MNGGPRLKCNENWGQRTRKYIPGPFFLVRFVDLFYNIYLLEKEMSIATKLLLSYCLVIMSNITLAMNEEKKVSSAITISGDSSLGQFVEYSSYVSGWVSNSFDSLKTTVNNFVYDDAAFKKLGWPKNDIEAQQELAKSNEIYIRVNNFLKNNQSYPEYEEDCNAINRRTQYCQRVLVALNNNTIPKDSDRVSLALHCLKHHKQVLNDFDKSKFLLSIQLDQEKIKSNAKEIDQELAKITIVPEDNDLLNNLLEQTYLIKEQEKQKQITGSQDKKTKK